MRPVTAFVLSALCLLGLAARATAQVGGSMNDDGDDDLRVLDEGDDEDGDDDLFDQPAATKEAAPRAVLLEPAGLSVLPVLSYGVGFLHELKPWLGEAAAPFALRLRYARGSATMGRLHATTELSAVEIAWSFRRWMYLAAGPAYRNVRATDADALGAGGAGSATSMTAYGVELAFGIVRPLGSHLLGCDIIGMVAPVGHLRRRGVDLTEIDDRDPHAEALDRAGTGRSIGALRVYFGPRF
jgi:hypothetical protein